MKCHSSELDKRQACLSMRMVLRSVACSQVGAGRTVGSQAEQAWSALGVISHRTRYQGIPNRRNTMDDTIGHYAHKKVMGLPDQLQIMHKTARRRIREPPA